MIENTLETLLERFRTIAEGGNVSRSEERYRIYAITNFRGGIGKSTLAFNLAWQMSRLEKTLLIDVCPQRNFTQSLLGDDLDLIDFTIYDALLSKLMPGTPEVDFDELICSVIASCPAFRGGKRIVVVPGSNELFLFPSILYTQLNTAAQLGTRRQETTSTILRSVETIIESIYDSFEFETVLIDTSPFFGGATHLAWVAADALIIPARVDQHSMKALELTLSMLRDKTMDFLRLNEQAGIEQTPKVHAIVMTHCGWSRQKQFKPDRSTQAYLTRVLDIANEYADLFSSENPVECIHLLDDFHSAGRISGSRRIPLARLRVGESHTIEGQRLEVNESLTRYQKELKSIAATL